MMKKMLFLGLLFVMICFFSACIKNTAGYSSCSGVPVANDSTALLNFAKTDSITPTKDTTGLYYQIITQGTGPFPTGTSMVYVTYSARLLDGTLVDSNSNAASTGFSLNGLIPAWQIGVPKIQAGGRIKLLSPSALAYGCQGKGSIPANAPVYFDIRLSSFQ